MFKRLGCLVAFALMACAAAPVVPPAPVAGRGPPAEMWERCPGICDAQGGLFLGVLAPTSDGPFICACAKKPEAAAQPQKWET